MADAVAFHAALERCGFNHDTSDEIIAQGFSLTVLATVKEEDIDGMIKNVIETRRALGPEAEGNVSFPFLAIKHFKAMRYWAAKLVRTGRPLIAGSFAGQEITNAVNRLMLDTLRDTSQEDDAPKKPKVLDDLSKWETFWEEWKTFAGRVRGAATCPIAWIHREHDEVTAAIYAATYGDHDAQLIATTILRGPWYELDNARVYDEFKALVLKGPGWSFIKQYDRTKNGRGAILALRRQCEGTSAVQTRKAMAYAKIAAAKYSWQKRQFTFDNYIEMHQDAHNTLMDLNEPVPETKKVTDFLSGITDSKLTNAKDLILGDAAKLQDFEVCQQYLKTLIHNKSNQEKHDRQISAVGGSIPDGGKSGGKKGKKEKGKHKGYAYQELHKRRMVQVICQATRANKGGPQCKEAEE
jgi:hypothetical protein